MTNSVDFPLAESIEIQRKVFQTIIRPYMSRPEEISPLFETEHSSGREDASTATQLGDDSSLHLRVLRSAVDGNCCSSKPEPSSSSPRHRTHKLFSPDGNWTADIIRLFELSVDAKADNLKRISEAALVLEDLESPIPYLNITNGQTIISDVPMVVILL